MEVHAAGAEGLLRLADLGALQVADLGGKALERGADQGEGLDEVGVAVARDDLGADGVDAEAEPGADALFQLRRHGRVAADRPAELADGDVVARRRRGGPAPRRTSSSQFSSLRPKVIGSACMPWVRPIIACLCARGRAAAMASSSCLRSFGDDVSRFDQPQRGRRVLGVVGGEAEVHPARFFAEAVVTRAQEGVHVVVHLALVAVDVFELEARRWRRSCRRRRAG